MIEYADLSEICPEALVRKRRARRQQETARRIAIFEWLTLRGVYVWRQDNSAPYNEQIGARVKERSRDHVDGLADLGATLPGGIQLQIETKSHYGKATPAQLKHLAKVRALGGVAFVARSVDEVEKNLETAGWRVVGGVLAKNKVVNGGTK